MIKIAICNVKDLKLEKAIKKVSQKRQEKINKYHFTKDKKLSCGAELLLNHLLQEENITNPIYEEDFYKKPYIQNHKIEFNLSHSKEMVACAISDKPIGIDIEYIDKNIDLDIAKHYFYNNEYENIIQAKDQAKEFFKYWVLKESFMKYTSLGFNINLDEFNIDLQEEHINVILKNKEKTKKQIQKNKDRTIKLENIKFKLFELKDYMLAISSQEVMNDYKEINIQEL
ncbi:MAG: 4'-phosphopantetheinyl transferase superfamily protein [Methanosphaera sp.]|nr:4'-phosphopantetheinyl transferase superfamily protein [Methanosphaera sp.]